MPHESRAASGQGFSSLALGGRRDYPWLMSPQIPDPRAILAARRTLLPEFEAQQGRRSPRDLSRALAIADALLEEAIALGVWPPADPLEGIEVDIRVAQALRRVP